VVLDRILKRLLGGHDRDDESSSGNATCRFLQWFLVSEPRPVLRE
jgi:hypothetical protein